MSVENLLKLNVNEHTEKKNGLTYLSWAWAWAEALKADPTATFEVKMFEEYEGGKKSCHIDINGTAMVFVTVTLFGKPMTCQLPVMDYRNKAILNPDAFAVNTAIMRCMTKGLALHGLGLYIFSGEDIPEEGGVRRKGDAPIITPKGNPTVNEEDEEFLREMAASCEELVSVGKAKEASEMLDEAMLDSDQKIWLWGLLTAPTRSAIKKQKG
jgi:hypothetical protein